MGYIRGYQPIVELGQFMSGWPSIDDVFEGCCLINCPNDQQSGCLTMGWISGMSQILVICQLEHFHDLTSHMAAVEESVSNSSELVLIYWTRIMLWLTVVQEQDVLRQRDRTENA